MDQISDQGRSESRCDQQVTGDQTRAVDNQVRSDPSDSPSRGSSSQCQVVMKSIVAKGKSLVTKTGCGKRRCGEDDGVRDGDAGRGGSGSGGSGGGGGDFDGDGSGSGVGGIDRDVGERKTGGEDEVGGLNGRATEASSDRVDVHRTGGVQVSPQRSGVQESVRKPEQQHIESPKSRICSSNGNRGSRDTEAN